MSKKTRHQAHEEHADESWLLPYADLLTLLLALFIVLYSMSASDAKKFEEMSDAFNSVLSSGSGVLEYKSGTPTSANLDLGKAEKLNNNVADKVDRDKQQELIKQEQVDLEKLKKRLDNYIEVSGLTTQLDTKLNHSQLMITISDNALFDSGKANVKPEARMLAKALSNIMMEFPDYDIIVSGHTDNLPISNSDYASNWDLSADRALQFMKILLLNDNLNPKKFSAIGYGEYHPIAPNDTLSNRAKNRRVEISIVRKYQDMSQVLSVTEVKN